MRPRIRADVDAAAAGSDGRHVPDDQSEHRPRRCADGGLQLVVRDALKVIAIGAAIGLIAAAMLGRVIVSMLFGVQPRDLPTFALVTIVLSAATALAIAGPTLRAAPIDPAVALRK